MLWYQSKFTTDYLKALSFKIALLTFNLISRFWWYWPQCTEDTTWEELIQKFPLKVRENNTGTRKWSKHTFGKISLLPLPVRIPTNVQSIQTGRNTSKSEVKEYSVPFDPTITGPTLNTKRNIKQNKIHWIVCCRKSSQQYHYKNMQNVYKINSRLLFTSQADKN